MDRTVLLAAASLLLAACGSGTPSPMPMSSANADAIRVALGDDVYVTGDQSAGGLANLRRVPVPMTPSEVIHLQLVKQALSSGPAFVLTVDNFFAMTFSYQALVQFSATPNVLMTSDTCSVMPRISDVELWPDPITSITFQDVVFRDASYPLCP
jgi:hypothetical protein